MQRNFDQVAKFLEQTFPELAGKIDGANFPPPPVVQLMLNVLWVIQLLGMAWMFLGGENILKMVGLARMDNQNRMILPPFYYKIQEHTVQIGIFLYLVLPQILQKYMITGAFEIYLDDQQVWSRLQTGTFPGTEDLIKPMVAAGLQQQS